MNPDVSIVIPSAGPGLRVRCVESIRAHTERASYEIILMCDNYRGPEPGLSRLVDRAVVGNWPSFAAICNAGRALARGKYVLFLNDDTAFRNDVPHLLSCYLEVHPSTGCVCPRVLDKRLQPTVAWGVFPFFVGSLLRFTGLSRFIGRSGERTRPVPYVTGACMMVRAGDGLTFDENFVPAYWEDADYCLRLRRRGREIVYYCHAVIVHEGSASWQDRGKRLFMDKNLDLFLHKHRGPGLAMIYCGLWTRFGTK